MFSPEIVATMPPGTQVLLDESDMERLTENEDDIEHDSPMKPTPKNVLRVKESFLDDDIDEDDAHSFVHCISFGGSLKSSVLGSLRKGQHLRMRNSLQENF